jgi:hypothetical protein
MFVITDISDETQPAYRAKWTLVFSSPNPKRYKEFMKGSLSRTYTLPTWSEQELMLVNANIGAWYERFVMCGGVARILFWDGLFDDPMNSVHAALQAKGVAVAEYFFKNGFGNVDPEKSYALLHINPPFSQELSRLWYEAPQPIHTFASDWVFQQLKSKFTTGLVTEATGWFNAGGGKIASEKLGAVSAGHLFEKICLWLVPFAGKTITPMSLSQQQAPLGSIVLPSMQSLPHDWKENGNLTCGVLYQPLISNLESGDAFCLLSLPNGGFCLVVLQVTVGEQHPVKANGLKCIFQAFRADLKEQILRKVIIFVTPNEGSLCTWQPLHNQNGKVMTSANIPLEARNFEQWVCRYHLSV